MAPLPARDARHRAALGDAGPARSVSALRHQRLLAGPGAGRPPRRGSRRPARGPRGRAGHRRGRLPARRASFAKHRTITALEHARALRDGRQRAGRDRGRGSAAGPLRRADRMSRPTTELAHLFRQLKAPAAARALPKLADRARAEEWSYEQFAAALLKTETDSRDSHGGQARIKAARFPARKTLEEFDFAFQTSPQARHRPASRPARLPRRQGERRPARPARHRQDAPLDRARDPRLPRRPPRRVPDRDRMGRAARRRPTPRPPRRRARPAAARSRC